MGKNVDNNVWKDLNEIGNTDPLHSDESSLLVEEPPKHTPVREAFLTPMRETSLPPIKRIGPALPEKTIMAYPESVAL